jgi:chlorite dismutase
MSDPAGPAKALSTQEEELQDFVKYSFFHLHPEWRRLTGEERRAGREEFADRLEHPPEGVHVRTYSLVGLKADTEMLVWSIAPRVEAIQELHAQLWGTRMGGYLTTSYSYLGLGRRSEYMDGHGHTDGEGSSARRRPFDRDYLFVYPFVKKREWYGIPFETRRKMMGEHFRIGHKYPRVKIHTGYSFGLDDMEFILAFEGDSPAEFLELVADLRPSEASRYTELETPIFTCRRTDAAEMLRLADGIP